MPADRSGTRMNSWYGRPISARSASMSVNTQASIWLLSAVRCGVDVMAAETCLGEQLRGGPIAFAGRVEGEDDEASAGQDAERGSGSAECHRLADGQAADFAETDRDALRPAVSLDVERRRDRAVGAGLGRRGVLGRRDVLGLGCGRIDVLGRAIGDRRDARVRRL